MNTPSVLARLGLAGWLLASVAIAPSQLEPRALVGAAGLAAGAACWLAGNRGRGDLVVLAVAAWLLPVWAALEATPATLRALAAAATIVSAPLLLHAVGVQGRLLGVIDAAFVTLVAAHLVWFDPFIDRRCSTLCERSALAVLADADSVSLVRGLDAWLPVGLILTGIVATRPWRAGWTTLTASAAIIVAMTARAAAIEVEPTDASWLLGNRLSLIIGAVAVAGTAGAAAWPSYRLLRARIAVGRITQRLADLAPRTDAVLAAATGDRALRVTYLHDETWVDADGVRARAPSRRAVQVRSGGRTIAAIDGIAGARVLDPATRLGLANESLRAAVLAELADLTASCRRIVVLGDRERRLLERNLHDGAQQGLVALSFELRRARAQASGAQAERLDGAIVEAESALAELREIAHGIFPALLTEAGLKTALNALADTAPMPITVICRLPDRAPPDVEMAAYHLVAETIQVVAHSDNPCEVEARVALDAALRIRVSHTSAMDIELRELREAIDRVTALGGAVRSARSGSTGTIEAEIPCAS